MSGYIGVSGKARTIKTMYIGIDGLARKVNTAYIGVNGKAGEWYTGAVPEPPNDKYEAVSLGTWSSTSDVDTFCATYNAKNGYEGLKLGNYVTIRDGKHNAQWQIAGFNLEYKQTAADGTVYNNGYGILMIPRTPLYTTYSWDNDDYSTTSYINSSIHKSTLPSISTNMQNILGSHMINRNVLLGSAQNGQAEYYTNITSAYTWTTSRLTLMSVGQLTGTFASNCTKYDDGEANYKLPLFNYQSIAPSGYSHWTRNVRGFGETYYYVYYVYNQTRAILSDIPSTPKYPFPLMLIR